MLTHLTGACWCVIMVSGSSSELLAMVRHVGVAVCWTQYAGTWKEHFDICKAASTKPIAAGAAELSCEEMWKFIECRRRKKIRFHHGQRLEDALEEVNPR